VSTRCVQVFLISSSPEWLLRHVIALAQPAVRGRYYLLHSHGKCDAPMAYTRNLPSYNKTRMSLSHDNSIVVSKQVTAGSRLWRHLGSLQWSLFVRSVLYYVAKKSRRAIDSLVDFQFLGTEYRYCRHIAFWLHDSPRLFTVRLFLLFSFSVLQFLVVVSVR